MFRLLKHADCFTPEHIGIMDIMTAYGRVAWIASDIRQEQFPFVQVFDCTGRIACPGFIDQHMHITGGGGEQGPGTIIGPIGSDMIAAAGVTTVVGLLGADGVAKSMQGLLMKARELEAEGLTAYIYCGNYGVPTVTITGSVLTDIALIDKIIGAGEIAISDHRSSYPVRNELIKLAHDVITGGMLGKKAGVVHMHVGDGKDGLAPLLDLLENTDFPVSMFVPTHLNRSKPLFKQAVQFHENGGIIDLTAGENTEAGRNVPDCLSELFNSRDGLDRVTVSSDANGSGAGEAHKDVASVMSLINDISITVKEYELPLEQVIRTVTENVAKVLKLYPVKGRLAAGSDADILLMNPETLTPDMVFAKGRLLLKGGRPFTDREFSTCVMG